MSILPMKRLQAIIPEACRDLLLERLMLLGCVEITEVGEASSTVPWLDRLRRDDAAKPDTLERLNAVKTALAALDRFCVPRKSRFFPELRSIRRQELNNPVWVDQTVCKARYLNRLKDDIAARRTEEEQLLTRRLFLVPWHLLDIPLDTASTGRIAVRIGVCPSAADPAALKDRLRRDAPESALEIVDTDQEQHYLIVILHRCREPEVDALLKESGFTPSAFKGLHGTAAENLAAYDRRLQTIREEQGRLTAKFEGLKDYRRDLEACYDALSLTVRREEMNSRMLRTPRTVYLTGWVPGESVDRVAAELDGADCAFEFSEPLESDEPPVAFRHSAVTGPFGIISALYGTPRYGSIVDPTPFMAPFFFVFFGMMVSDAAYGVILSLAALWMLRRVRQPGFLRQALILVLYCGISTLLWGILFGSWFGDFIPAVSKMLTGTAVSIPPLWMDPLKQPMDMLMFAFVLGGLQILTGLGLAGWRQIRSGRWQDALYDTGFWYLILVGLVMGAVRLPFGLEIAAVGAVGVVLTAGRREKNPLKRLLTGVLSLYSVTGYLSDVLSYSRLLALGLASAVIASVINAMGTIGGNTPGGIIALAVIFIFGHLFNLAINLVGAYVHASRLQYVEFFSKFYVSGGQPFTPLAAETKYVVLEKEDSPWN